MNEKERLLEELLKSSGKVNWTLLDSYRNYRSQLPPKTREPGYNLAVPGTQRRAIPGCQGEYDDPVIHLSRKR